MINTLIFKVTKKEDDAVYDIVIDPGHGGIDVGASINGYYESYITLEYSKYLKTELENLGLKVALTRYDDSNPDEYGISGRATLSNELKAKLTLSIHLNSTDQAMTTGGVEIYSTNNADLTFASSLANNIVENVQTVYSLNNVDKVYSGVYVRNFTDQEIIQANEYARKVGYENYNITTDTPYLFMIREVGGIMTSAYVDGRNKYYEKNEYYNSNIASESYLLELGYMTDKNDMNNLLTKKELYVQSIVKSIQNLYNI